MMKTMVKMMNNTMDNPAMPMPRILREGPITPELCDRAAEHIEVQNANLATLAAINAELVEALTEAAAVIEHKVPMLSNISLPGKRLVVASVLRKCMETLARAKEASHDAD
jgi:hypothetical protein